MSPPPPERLEELLAQALEAFDTGGDAAVERLLADHPAERTAVRRGLLRCREMGMLGKDSPARDFPERLGDFRLLRRLGSGGMGVVYEAEQVSLGRRVALKVIRPELLWFEGARERFRREIEAVARLSHPAVVPVLASGEQDGVPFYAMELLAGRTAQEITAAFAGQSPGSLGGERLGELLDAGSTAAAELFHGPWWQVCTRVIHAIALGVRHAHVRGIVHRDIKPSNVMVTPHGTAVLLDFGIASFGDARDVTRTGSTPGSPAFMSPEQLRGDAVDERTDVYSLGATLWQLLTLVAPFRGADLLQRIRNGELPSLRASYREVPRELEIVVHKAMDRDRERRYADMDAFAADLQAVLLRRPIQARRLGAGLRALRWSQRHRVAATLLLTAVVVTALLPAVFAWRERRVNEKLHASNAVVEANLDATLAALDSVLVRLGGKRLRHVPHAQQMAIDSLQDAVRVYRLLLPQQPAHRLLRQQAGRALDSLAAALQRLGRLDEAVAAEREAIDVLGGERMDLPPRLLDGRAYVEMNLANIVHAQGDAAAALRWLEAAERDFAAVADVAERRVSYVRGRSELLTTRANLPPVRGDAAAMELALRESLELTREWMRLSPDDLEARATEIHRIDNLATFLNQHRRGDEAAPLLADALQKARSLPFDAMYWPPQPALVSEVLETLGILQLTRRDMACMDSLRECLQLRERLAQEFPADLAIRTKLGGAAHNLATAFYRQERDDEAIVLFDRAHELQRSVLQEVPTDPLAREYLTKTLVQRGACLRQLGRRDALLANAEELAAFDTEPGPLRTAALQFLRAIELLDAQPGGDAAVRERAASRALECLQAAERLGWGRGSRFDEAVYAPLRAFPEFAELERRVAARLQTRVVESPSAASTSSASRESPR